MRRDYDLNDWGLCVLILIAYGVAFRAIAFVCLLTFQKKWIQCIFSFPFSFYFAISFHVEMGENFFDMLVS